MNDGLAVPTTSKRALALIFATVFIDLLGFGIVLPLLPRYGEVFHATKLQLGLLMASFSAMQFLFAPLWGRLSDRIGRRPVLLVGLAGSAVSYAVFAWVTEQGNAGEIAGFSPLAWLFASRIAAGIAGATIPTAQAYIADCTGAAERSKGMAIIGAAFGIGFTFGPLLGACFVPEIGATAPSSAPGYVAAILSAGAFLFAMFLLPESLKRGDPAGSTHSHRGFSLAALLEAIRKPYIGRILLTIFITTFAFAQFESTLTIFTKRLGFGDRSNFYIFAFIGFVLVLAQGGLIRRLLPKVGEYRLALVGTALMGLGLLLTGWMAATVPVSRDAGSTNKPDLAEGLLAVEGSAMSHGEKEANLPASSGSGWLLIAILPIIVVGFSATTPSVQGLLSLNTHDADQGGVLGIGQSVSSLARIAGPVVGFWLTNDGIERPYLCGAIVMGLGLMLVGTLKSASRRSTDTATAEVG